MGSQASRLVHADTAPRYFLAVASLLYLGVLVTGGAFAAANLCTMRSIPNGLFIFFSAIVLLLGLEQFAYRQYGFYLPWYVALALLMTRMAVFEVIAAVDCSGLSRALYPLIPFIAFFTLGKRASYGLAVFYVGLSLLKFSLFIPDWYLNQAYISDGLMLLISLVFAISMAHVAHEAEVNRRRAESFLINLRRSHQKLEIYAEQVAELATTEERNRLARDVHDGLGHYLTTISVLLEKAIAFRTRNAQEADLALVDARRITREALQDIRQSVSALRLPGDRPSLRALLTNLVSSVDQETTRIQLEIEGDESDVPHPGLMCLYRVAQEALTNTRKHASATHIRVTAHLSGPEATLDIHDDGKGFDITSPALNEQARGLGLRGIRERVELVGGTLEIRSRPQQGTHIRATIPKTHGKEAFIRYAIQSHVAG